MTILERYPALKTVTTNEQFSRVLRSMPNESIFNLQKHFCGILGMINDEADRRFDDGLTIPESAQ